MPKYLFFFDRTITIEGPIASIGEVSLSTHTKVNRVHFGNDEIPTTTMVVSRTDLGLYSLNISPNLLKPVFTSHTPDAKGRLTIPDLPVEQVIDFSLGDIQCRVSSHVPVFYEFKVAADYVNVIS